VAVHKKIPPGLEVPRLEIVGPYAKRSLKRETGLRGRTFLTCHTGAPESGIRLYEKTLQTKVHRVGITVQQMEERLPCTGIQSSASSSSSFDESIACMAPSGTSLVMTTCSKMPYELEPRAAPGPRCGKCRRASRRRRCLPHGTSRYPQGHHDHDGRSSAAPAPQLKPRGSWRCP
jgi:hypothetical protein